MPTRPNTAKSKASPTFPPTEWVSCELTEDEKKYLKSQEVSDSELLENVAAVLAAGFKVSISFDERSDCVGAYLTAPRGRNEAVTHCLSARAPFLQAALHVLLYKHFTKLKEDWGAAAKETGKRDQWG